ncbi:peptidase domain-containing ABC transporter [Propionispora vibrioides]|uniref:ATP-binding cassette, subfamily B, HlyB/CyaB n=1 Tax=Propionispora vibrioides TaxID=112903 RepID=A0A1H8XSM0_9FIRM|nr:type I secretion system permease/ATPase [Propionispora vibrioides]SEP42762.1 ATP-binding cassette, subfamily B, HlyB/CyaB [Propionispora vibrioides]
MMTNGTLPPGADKLDTALKCLLIVAGYYGIPAVDEQLRRAYVVKTGKMDTLTLVRAARGLGFKARAFRDDAVRLNRMALPAIAVLKNGNYVVLGKWDGEAALIIDPCREQPFALPRENFLQAWSGELVLFTRRIEATRKQKKFGLSWFVPVIWRYRNLWGKVLGLSLLLQLFGLASPFFTQRIIDDVLVHHSVNSLDAMLSGMIFVSLFQTWITGVRTFLFTHATNQVDVMLGAKLFRQITALPVRYFETWQVGEVVARVRELENVRQFITGSAITVVLDVVFTVVYMMVMFLYSTTLSIIALLILPLYILLNAVVTPLYRSRLQEQFAAGTENQTFLIEMVTGIHTVKALAVEPQLLQEWEQRLARYIEASFRTANLANIAGSTGTFIQQFFILLVLWFGARQVMGDSLSVGGLMAFQMLAGQIFAPVLRLVSLWQSFQQVGVSVERLGDIMNETAEPAFNPNRTTLPAVRGDIVFDRVTFRYRQDATEVLQQVKLQIRAESSVGIVGRSGSGKSTLTKLMQRLYVPESGRILIDGVDLAQVEPAWLRRQIGVVLQDTFLFNGTVRDNIAAACPGASIADVVKAARMSGAHEFISEMAQGYDTAVGERGSALSGGQRQRLAIARALLTNPRILIFDEATSALDYESEHRIMENLSQMAAGRTLIMIAHRLSTVRHCDQIIVLDRGRVMEQGSHEELVQLQGIYYSLYQQQNPDGTGPACESVTEAAAADCPLKTHPKSGNW